MNVHLPWIAIAVQLSFWVTVKAATLIFISGHGLAISSVQERKHGSIYNLVEIMICLSRANVLAFHENRDRIYTELSSINP